MGDPVVFAAAYLFAIGGVGFLVGCGLWALLRRREARSFREELAGRLPGYGLEERVAALEQRLAELHALADRLQKELADGGERRAAAGDRPFICLAGLRQPPAEGRTLSGSSDIEQPVTDDRIQTLARELRRPTGEVQLMLRVRRLRTQ